MVLAAGVEKPECPFANVLVGGDGGWSEANPFAGNVAGETMGGKQCCCVWSVLGEVVLGNLDSVGQGMGATVGT